MKKNNYFRGDLWFQRQVDQRTRESLRKQEAIFERDHQAETNEQLLQYVRNQAASLGFVPAAKEIIGGKYISNRFGGWGNVIAAAHLQASSRTPPLFIHCKLYKEEYRRQVDLFRKERNKNKIKRG